MVYIFLAYSQHLKMAKYYERKEEHTASLLTLYFRKFLLADSKKSLKFGSLSFVATVTARRPVNARQFN